MKIVALLPMKSNSERVKEKILDILLASHYSGGF